MISAPRFALSDANQAFTRDPPATNTPNTSLMIPLSHLDPEQLGLVALTFVQRDQAIIVRLFRGRPLLVGNRSHEQQYEAL